MQICARSWDCFPGSVACLPAQACRLTTQTQQWPQRWPFIAQSRLPDCVCMQAEYQNAAATATAQSNPLMQ